jgi:enoyl-CoA hydratase/carnithine racemase
MRLIMTGAAMSAEDAVRIGFAEVLCHPDDLVARVQAFAEELAARPRYALVAAKRLVRASLEMPLSAGLAHEAETLANMATPAERDAEKLRARTGDNTYRKLFK